MKFQLTSYQVDAVTDVISALQDGYGRFKKSHKLTAVALSAPTGAGKTVIATAVIERMLYGDEDIDPNSELCVLWVTDDPSLNVQTRRKMLVSSSNLKPNQLVTVDATLDQKMFDPGKVYFVHIQQLGKGATNYNKVGNKRQYSLWDTIGNTISNYGSNFLLIVDEAHRGTTGKTSGGGQTITAQLMDGAGGTFPPAPVVLGISATPQRFADAIAAAGQRTMDPVAVDPEAVRESGLIKDKLRIKHPTGSVPSDTTLLQLGVQDLRSYDELWSSFSEEQDEPLVRPVLVVQIKAKASAQDISVILDAMESGWNVLSGKAIAHSFQDHTALSIGTRSVRYLAPHNIQDDPDVRAVLFKEALTTGWDCPRAEVMVSLRPAKDFTYIAQLIGRMVRTPLARRVTTNDVLNTVALYLPYFDEAHVDQVVQGLQSDDSQVTSTVEVNGVVCERNALVPENVWSALALVPTYTRPGKYHRNDVARLNSLAILLVGNHLDSSAMDAARAHLNHTLEGERIRIGAALDAAVSALEQLDYQTQIVDLTTGAIEKESSSVPLSAQNTDDLFRRAKRILGDAAAAWYWDKLCDDGVDPDKAKTIVAALAGEASVVVALEAAAKTLVDTWRDEHSSQIGHLQDSKRAQFYEIWQQSKVPERVSLIMPAQVTAAERPTRYEKHLYVHGESYPCKLTGWEKEVLELELQKPTLIAWYRNPSAGAAALAVPYDQSGTARTMYPDYLFFHDVNGELVVDIVDPHRPDQGDTGPKWTGLSKYAKRHATAFRRIVAVIKSSDGKLLGLDLKTKGIEGYLEKAGNETDIRKIFDTYAGKY